MPRAMVSFHWPRADLDQLLTLRVEDISSCQWSGGFPLNKDHSFHIHMRCDWLTSSIANTWLNPPLSSIYWVLCIAWFSNFIDLSQHLCFSIILVWYRGTSGHSIFVRCNVTLKGATHHVIFSDAALFPTPFRLENLSQIGRFSSPNLYTHSPSFPLCSLLFRSELPPAQHHGTSLPPQPGPECPLCLGWHHSTWENLPPGTYIPTIIYTLVLQTFFIHTTGVISQCMVLRTFLARWYIHPRGSSQFLLYANETTYT